MAPVTEKLGTKTVRGVAWALTSTAASKLIWLIGIILLARLLIPEQFGVVAIALVFITYVETLGDLGANAALIYWQSRERDVAQITFVINVLMGLIWFTLTWFISASVAIFFGNPQVESILQVLAISFVIKGFSNTHDALCQRALDFRTRTIPEIVLATTKVVIGVSMAITGYGAWSLVGGHLAGLLLWAITLWLLVPWRPRACFPADLLMPVLKYGKGIIAVNVLAAIAHHLDLLVVGRMLGATALGVYQLATKLPELTIILLAWVVSRVLFPAFSRLNATGADMRNAYLRSLQYLSLFTLPGSVALFVLADPLIMVMFGEQWRDAIPVLQWLAVYAGIRSLGTQVGDVLKATGQPHVLTRLGIVKVAILIPVLLYAGNISIVAVAISMSVAALINTAINILVICHILNIGALSVIKSVRSGFMAASVLATVMFAWSFIDCCESSLLEFLVRGGPILVTSIFLMMYLEPTLIQIGRAHV